MGYCSSKAIGQGWASLCLQDVCYTAEGKRILKHISIDVTASRIGIIGRNGSGKSTLARLLAGLVKPSSGDILVNGADLFSDRKAALSEVGILFQNPDHQIIFPTVGEEIAFGLLQQGHSKRRSAELGLETLSEFGKSHWAEADIAKLSQGQKHLVCLMAIFAMQPNVIILDEPFTGMDIPTKMQLVRYLSRYKGGLVHITHDPSDISEYEQLVWLEEGQVRNVGHADNILKTYVAKMHKLGGLDDISFLSH